MLVMWMNARKLYVYLFVCLAAMVWKVINDCHRQANYFGGKLDDVKSLFTDSQNAVWIPTDLYCAVRSFSLKGF